MANAKAEPRFKREMVSATVMARHLCFERPYLDRLIAHGVIEKADDGRFDLNDTRRRYVLHLREERKRSPRSEADVSYQTARADLIRLRVLERQKQLIPAETHDAFVEDMTGLFLSGLSGLAAKIAGADLGLRRRVDQAVFELRRELAQAAIKLADERGEPPLSEQGSETRPSLKSAAGR
jgi:hypothetical protein